MTTNWKLGLGFSLVTVVMWGLLPLALKSVLEVMDPLTISWYRLSVSAFVALLWYGHSSGPAVASMFSRGQWPLTMATVGGLVCNYIFYIWGLNYINPGASQILIQLAPLMLLIGSVFIFKERFSLPQWLGVAGFTSGMLLFFHQRLGANIATDSDYLIGVVFIIAAALTWAVYGVAQKQLLLNKHHAKNILFLICVAGTVLLWPLAEPQQIHKLNSTQLLLLLFCGINTIIAYGSFGLAMSYWQASRVSAIIPIAPLLTLLFTFGLNHWQLADIPAEPMDWLSYLGALLVVTALPLLPYPDANPYSFHGREEYEADDCDYCRLKFQGPYCRVAPVASTSISRYS